jgi:uncharacterized protein (TIGR00255 family)
MTAFGRTQKESSGYSVTIEIRALNGRFLDIVLRLPKNYMEFEEPLRKLISQSIRRGRIEVFVQVESKLVEKKAPRINVALARFYWEQLQDLHRQLPGVDKPSLDHLLKIPYLFDSSEAMEDRELLQSILTESVTEALEQIQQMRCREGEALKEDFHSRLSSLREDLSLIEGKKDLIVAEYQKRLREKMEELLGEIQLDENRLLQEVACYADRSDINEETVRLQSHIEQILSLLSETKPVDGKKLDFLTQELHREVNTIGCKTGDLDVLQAVVRMKTEIGKLKEQVQNVE